MANGRLTVHDTIVDGWGNQLQIVEDNGKPIAILSYGDDGQASGDDLVLDLVTGTWRAPETP